MNDRASGTPIVGICSYQQEAAWGAWKLPAALIPSSYVESVREAGGRPLIVPPQVDGVEETLAALDGLILSGGTDIDPTVYGAERDARTDPPQPHRDNGELALLEAALARDLPVLAICRGMQLLNVARGGTLSQHLPDDVGHEGHRETLGVFSLHHVELAAGSRAAAILGETTDVHSHHHQGIERTGDGLTVVGQAEDGSIEAIEDPRAAFVLGVLWHPEEHDDKALFRALVEEARGYRLRCRREGGLLRRGPR